MTNPVSPENFAAAMAALPVSKSEKLAVAVSGGADSMALAYLLSRWGAGNLHILTVDHGLRKEAKNEAAMVARFAKSIGAKCRKFKWIAEKPQNSIQEEARRARYEMMAEYCRKNKIRYLFLAHHADDQMETFLFRLAKGSGPQGLSCMKQLQTYDENLVLARPLLSVTHADLVATVKEAGIEWAEDPSNLSLSYMRGRMRGAREILEKEGLTSKRIGALISRLEREGSFIAQQVEKEEKNIIKEINTKRIAISFQELKISHPEVVVRVLQKAIAHLRPDKDFPARLEDIERLSLRIRENPEFRGATLGGVKFALKEKRTVLELAREGALIPKLL